MTAGRSGANKTIGRIAAGLAAMMLLAGCQGSSTEGLSATTSNAWNGPQSGPIGPFKEQAFRYRTPLEVDDGGRYLRVPYDEWVDINKRDEVPVRKVKSWWVRRIPPDAVVEREYRAGGRSNKYLAVGKLDGGSKMTVIYVHGRGGNRLWGFDDERFGGNFNRLKNLMLRLGGAYISPDFTDFDAQGLADIKALIAQYRPLTDGPLVVSCGSLGNKICWNLTQSANSAGMLDGLIVMAGFPDDRFFSSPAARGRPVPLIISHGSWDPDYDYKPTLEFYRRVRKTLPSYPIRYILFETGKHGAPVRMIDWRDALNWIAAN